MATFVEMIQHATGAIGAAGGGVAAYAFKRFRAVEKRALQTSKGIDELKRLFDDLKKLFEETKAAFRMELTTFKDDIEDRLDNLDDPRHGRISTIPDSIEAVDKSFADRLEKLRLELTGEILRERGQRHALKRDFDEFFRENSEKWTQLNRLLGKLETLYEMKKMT